MDSKRLSTEIMQYWIVINNLIALCTNCVVLVSSEIILYRGEVKPKPAFVFLANLASIDVVFSLWLIYAIFHFKDKDPYSIDVLDCMSVEGFYYGFIVTSLLSVLLIAVERFCFIVHGIKYQILLNTGRARLLTILTWIIGQIIGILPAAVATFSNNYVNSQCIVDNSIIVSMIASGIAYTTLAGTLVLYILMYCESQKCIKQHEEPQKVRKMLIFCFVTSFCFIVTWLPLLIYSTLHIFYCYGFNYNCFNFESDLLIDFFQALSYTNSFINPILYAWWHKPYKREIEKVICPKKKIERVTIYHINSISSDCV